MEYLCGSIMEEMTLEQQQAKVQSSNVINWPTVDTEDDGKCLQEVREAGKLVELQI